MDGFMFGSCCVHNEDQNKVIVNEEEVVASTTTSITSTLPSTVASSERPTRPSRPEKPSHHLIKWPNFHLVEHSTMDEKNEKHGNQQHFVSIQAPMDPRPKLTTTKRPSSTRKPTIVFVGDSAAEEDYSLSAIGWAVTKKLPILFVIEDNNLSILTEKKVRRSWEMSDVATGFGMKHSYNISDNPLVIKEHMKNVFEEKLALILIAS